MSEMLARARLTAAWCALSLLVWVVPDPAAAAGPRDEEPRLGLELVATGLDSPVAVVEMPGDPQTLLLVQQGGTIVLLNLATGSQRTFLEIRAKIGELPSPWWRSGGAQGLLGLALSPDWPEDRHLFVNYTTRKGVTVIERYRARPNLKGAKRGSARTVLTIEQPDVSHNGGDLHFGPDGMLYVAMGDGGCCGDPRNVAQDLDSLLGKMLRLDVSSLPYEVPEDNPTFGGEDPGEIWALGLRNPWRFAFDRKTGELYIGDVGERSAEEINYLPRGLRGGVNFGWKVMEGELAHAERVRPATRPLRPPIHQYRHGKGTSVTGGRVYRGTAIDKLDGHYFFADFISRRIWSFVVENGRARRVGEWTDQLVTTSGEPPVVTCFGEDAAGELYLCDYLAGDVYKVVPASRLRPR